MGWTVAIIANLFFLQGFTKPIENQLIPRNGANGAGSVRQAMPLLKRDADRSFDLGFQVKDQTLFSGSWEPLAGQTVDLSLKCVDCRTWGTLDASATFPEDVGDLLGDLADFNPLNDVEVSVDFKGVGALFDLTATAALEGTVKIPLFKSESPLGIAVPNFQVGLVFTVDLVLGLSGEANVGGGFQVSIPDGSTFKLPLDPGKDHTAKFDGVSTALLPLSAEVPANVTLALQLGVSAGVDFKGGIVDATALAGAFINIPEVIIGEQFSTANSCIPAFALVDINAGVFVDIGADIGSIELPGINPTVSTTLFAASTSTCFGAGPSTSPTVVAAPDCPVDLVTKIITTSPAQSLVACAVSAVNCPASLTQNVLVQGAQTVTTASCPTTIRANTTSVVHTVVATSDFVTLSPMKTPIISTLSVGSSVTVPAPTITASPSATSPNAQKGAIGTITMTVPCASGTTTASRGPKDKAHVAREEPWSWPTLRVA
ncbi:uncharacterized protein JN550_004544 [Neoarthrinium moseri]|uniref:uncharacterized protein n=1 Tax=Neoarthrinium moseri TaxID=1658444 RepID=UPI001FDCEE6E|nr:uncharacterized protein JN550_004544 [Neoarthrinium moseri]KAI1871550.1 hypothetical protein JN550_004544 [Neoarthrinium moseri]